MTLANVDESGPERADAIMERLRSEQSMAKGLAGAFFCGLLGMGLAYVVNLTDIHSRTTIATAFIGVLVAFGMRHWGRGVDRRFQLVSLILTGIMVFSSVVLSGCLQRATMSRYTLEEMIELLNPNFSLVLFKESMNASSIFLWAIALVVAWTMSGRKLSHKDLAD